MKSLVIIFVSIYLNISVGAQQPRIVEGLVMKSKILKQEVKYSIILPEDYYSSRKTYPVVYLLHGLGDNESSWLEYGRVSQYVDPAVRRKEIIPMIYIMPQGYRNYYVNDYADKFLYQDMFVKEFVPHIDSCYRTQADKEHRAILGYSMGGFGALILPLKNPDVFTISVPLSISLRTDEQYKTEDASGWDGQWGRLFGAEGETGEARLTTYYKQHSPFHIFRQNDLSALRNLRLYISNGDDEETLARSNEELYILLRERNFTHQFRVRNGGHEFSYWRDALPDALAFISDAMQGKPYRGDRKVDFKPVHVSKKTTIINTDLYDVVLPAEYAKTQRKYPVIYFFSDTNAQQDVIAQANSLIANNTLAPALLVFVKKHADAVHTVMSEIEETYRARTGYRFRAVIGTGAPGLEAFKASLIPEIFTSCVLFDVAIEDELLHKTVSENKESFSRMWLFIQTTDRSEYYKQNSAAHILLRDENIYHEYRVHERGDTQNWFLNQLAEALRFIERKFHR